MGSLSLSVSLPNKWSTCLSVCRPAHPFVCLTSCTDSSPDVLVIKDCCGVCVSVSLSVNSPVHSSSKLQALVYDIPPSTTAVFSYAIGLRKLSANEQFLVGAQTVVSLLQTTQVKQGVPFIAANKVYTRPAQIKPQSFELRRIFLYIFFSRGGCTSCLRACFGARLLLRSY